MFVQCSANNAHSNTPALLRRVNSKREFVLWLCEQHNLVNTKLGKDTVPCDYEALEDRWTRPCLKEE